MKGKALIPIPLLSLLSVLPVELLWSQETVKKLKTSLEKQDKQHARD